MWACYQLFNNYFLTLILFTILIQVLMLPLTIRQKNSMAQNTALAPETKRIQDMYKNNQERMQQELQQLHQDSGYKASAGCAPMLIQLPILFGLMDVIYRPLHYIVRMSAEMVDQAMVIANAIPSVVIDTKTRYPELGLIRAIQDHPEAFSSMDPALISRAQGLQLSIMGFDMSQLPVLMQPSMIFPILAGVCALLMMLYTQYVNKKASPTNTAPPGMGIGMMLMSPAMSIMFGFSFPLGLNLYWSIRSLVTLVQEYILNIFMPQKVLVQNWTDKMEAQRKLANQGKKSKKKTLVVDGEEITVTEKEYVSKRLAVARDADKIRYVNDIDDAELAEKIEKLNAARRRDAEKYNEPFVEATAEDFTSL